MKDTLGIAYTDRESFRNSEILDEFKKNNNKLNGTTYKNLNFSQLFHPFLKYK